MNVIYHLPVNKKRACDIKVYSDRVTFEGKFWYLRNREFYRSKASMDVGDIGNFLGMGYLTKRSYIKCIIFVLAGTILGAIKSGIDMLSEYVDKANNYLRWIGQEISLPGWMEMALNAMTIICIVLGIVLFFSKKKVIEISFTDKRICVPSKSISKTEYIMLQNNLKKLYAINNNTSSRH